MSFFEPPPPPEEPPESYRQPDWLGPPDNYLGVGVPLQLVLARTERSAVWINGCTAYPLGVVFTVSLRLRPGSLSDEERRTLMHGSPFHPRGWQGTDELPPELLRFGVLFPDGQKATSLDYRRAYSAEAAPDVPVLMPRGGGGGENAWNMVFWLWPLPPPGALTFVVEWPALGIPETHAECDGAAIVAAAATAEPLWPEESNSGAGGWVESVSSMHNKGQNDDA